MVYYDSRKRRGHNGPNKPSTPKVSITDLPDELLLKILEDVPTADILKVRALGHKLSPACTDALQHRLKVLYVHPKPSSLKRAVAICVSGFAAKVEVICLLGQVLWQDILKKRPDARGCIRHPSTAEYSAKFQPWPDRTCGQWPSSVYMPRTMSSAFSNSYKFLLYALATLPQARALRYHGMCDQPGFNQLSEADIRAYAESHAVSKASGAKIPPMAYTEFEAVFTMLRKLDCLTSLDISEELPLSDANGFGSSFGRLTTLNLHCSAGWNGSRWQAACSEIVGRAPMLQDLCLKFQHNAAIRRANVDTSLENIIGDAELLALKRIELVALLPPPVDNPIARNRTSRPLLQRFNLAAFLTNHAGLVNVKLNNVIFIHAENLNDASVAFGGILGAAAPDVSLQWIVNRFDRDPRCNKFNNATGHTCRYDCFRYCPPDLGALKLPYLDTYMAEMGVELGREAEQEDQFWDIGMARKQVQSKREA